MSKKTFIKRIVSIILCFCIILGMSNLNFVNNKIPAVGTTTIDLTGLATGSEVSHDCSKFLVNKYDGTNHWKECTIPGCGKTFNKAAHSYTTNYWTLGSADKCSSSNVHVFGCSCGYSYSNSTGRANHVLMGGYQYNTSYHVQLCSVCLAEVQNRGYHKTSSGASITCTSTGTCATCGFTHAGYHEVNISYGSTGTMTGGDCGQCGVQFYDLAGSTNSIVYNGTQFTYTLNIHIPMAASVSLGTSSGFRTAGLGNISSTTSSWNAVSKVATFVISGQYNAGIESVSDAITTGISYVTTDGRSVSGAIWAWIDPEHTAPTISNIAQTDVSTTNGWSTGKTLTITGTENYCQKVSITLKDAAGNVYINNASASVNSSGNWTYTSTPNIEAPASGTNFTLIVKDSFGNQTSKTFTVSKTDKKVPNKTSSAETSKEWTTSKTYRITATDAGIGQVQIAFNNTSEYQTANVSGTTFYRDYNFTGDVYGSITGAFYLKDGLGNTSTQYLTVYNIDNTKPTITTATSTTGNQSSTVTATAHDNHATLGAGSGVSSYAISSSNSAPSSGWQTSNKFTITTPGTYYVFAKDAVGNISSGKSVTVYIEYNLTYDYGTNGGDSATTTSAKYNNGSTVSLSPTATKTGDTGVYNASTNPDGWVFVGWNTDKNATTKLTSFTMPSKDTTLYAIYKKTVTLNQIDKAGNNYQTKEIFNTATTHTFTTSMIRTYSGWDVTDWTTSASSLHFEDYPLAQNSGYTIASDSTIYGLYQRSLKLTYNLDGGKGSANTFSYLQYVNSSNFNAPSTFTYTLADTPQKTGFTFKGWKDSIENKTYGAKASYVIKESVTMTAQWERNQYQLTYDYATNGGKSTTGTNGKVYFDYDIDLTPKAVKDGDTGEYSSTNVDGWQFVGWNTDPNATVGLTSLKMPANDLTLYAIYKKDLKLTMIDSSSTRNLTATVYNTTTSYQFTTYGMGTYTGWENVGWSTSSTLKNESVNTKSGGMISIIKDTTIYGVYKRNITLSYNPEGGNPTPESVTYTQYTNSSKISDLSTYTFNLSDGINKTGFTFKAWGENSTSGTQYAAKGEYTLSANTSMHAVWERNKYTVTYDYWTNGGTATTKTSEQILFEHAVDLSPTATKDADTGKYAIDNPDGWKFLGWSLDPNDIEVLGEYNMPSHDVTLYAIYEKTFVVTTIDVKESAENKLTYSYTVYNNDLDENHTFKGINTCKVDGNSAPWNAVGWSIDKTPTTTNINTVGSTVSLKADTTYYAIYERALPTYFVSYDGSSRKEETILGTQKLNASNISVFDSPSIKTPSAYVYNGDNANGAWSVKGWSMQATNNPADIVLVGAEIQNDSARTYYAIYERNLSFTYVDYKGSAQNTRTVNAPNTTSAYDIGNYLYSTLVLEDLNTYTGWTPCYWADNATSVTAFANAQSKLEVTYNRTLYGVYKRDISFNFVKADGTQTINRTQHANAGNIETTKTQCSYTTPSIPSTSINSQTWDGVFWTTSTSNSEATGIGENTIQSSKESVTYYAMYETTYLAQCISIRGSSQSTQRIEAKAKINASDTTKVNNPVITMPNLASCTYDGQTWTSKGWSLNTSATAGVIEVGENYTLTKNTVFYGIYTTGLPATFIQYNGQNKITTTQNVGTLLNSYSFDMDKDTAIAPAAAIYNDGTQNWVVVGWTLNTTPGASVDFKEGDVYTLDKGNVFYAVYEKEVVLSLIDYLNTTKTTRNLEGKIYANSYNISNIQDAILDIPMLNNCTLNNDTWIPNGWNDAKNVFVANHFEGDKIAINKDTTLYGIYSSEVTLTYDTQGSGRKIPSVTENKFINSGEGELNPTFTITSTNPTRSGYVFQKVWRTNTNSGNDYLPRNSYAFNKDTTLYAQWGIEVISKTVTVNFNDNANQLNSRPDKVYINLYRDGVKTTSYIVSTIDNTVCSPSANKTIPTNGQEIAITSNKNNFTFTFDTLQKYDATDGHEYVYTVIQESFTSANLDVDYSTSYSADSFTITNQLVNSGDKKITGSVTWIDSSNKWYLRPETVKLTLTCTDPDTNVVTSQSKTIMVGPSDSFDYEFVNLKAINSNGNAYIYKVIESDIKLYKIESFTGTNPDGTTYINFENTLTSLPNNFTGGAGNKLVIEADAFDFTKQNANKEDFEQIGLSEDKVILVTLKQIKKTWNGDKEVFNNNVYATDHDTGDVLFYNVIVTPNNDTQVDYLADGRYEVIVQDDMLFDFEKFVAQASELHNATLHQENGRYFITFGSGYDYSAILNLHADLLLNSWRGYSSIKDLTIERNYTIIN